MNRKSNTLPMEQKIERSLAPQPTGRTAERRRDVRRASMLLACVAVATLVSVAVMMSVGGGKETTALPPAIPGSSADIPPPPNNIFGYTYQADGTTIMPDCTVTITNTNTGESVVMTSDENGWYEYDLNTLTLGWEVGDVLHVEAVSGSYMGEAEDVAAVPYVWVDVTLNILIPEFPMVVLPVIGMLALFGVARYRHRKA